MAYQTGTITGTDALISALSTTMQANGWTLIDTLASDDLVFKSSGSSGKFPMIVRISDHDRTTPFNIKYLAHPSRCVPHVAMRAYHFWYTPGGTPIATPVNGTFTTTTTGGTITAGTQAYRISAIGSTGETLASTETTIVTTGSTSTVTLNWTTVSGAIGYNIYGRSTGAELKLTTVWGGGTTTWLDTGALTPSGALPVSNTAHGGLNEYGVLGESLMIPPTNGSFNGYLTEYRLDSAAGPTVPNTSVSTVWPSMPQITNTSIPIGHRYVGDRYIIGPAQNAPTQFRVVDLATGDSYLSSGNPSGYNVSGSSWDVVYDAVNDKWMIYYLSNTNFTAADGFWKFDIDTGTHTRNATVPWAGQAVDGFAVWDGSDTIYIMRGNNTTDFHKYSISGNSYTTLTSAPQARSTNGFSFGSNTTMQYYVYVPSSATIFTSDVIYTMLDDSSSSGLYAYNVTANAWNNAGSPNLAAIVGGQQAHPFQLCYDGQNYLYYFARNVNNLLYRLNVQSTLAGWTNGNAFDGTSVPNSYGGAWILNHTVARVKVHTTNISTYYFIVTQDGVTVAINNGGLGKYYWMYAGRMTSRRKSSIMTTTTSSFGPGTNVTVAVDNSVNYLAGDKVYCFDPATGKQEASTIYSVNSSASITLTLANTYTVGSFIACDPFQTVLTGDQGLACAPADPHGYKASGCSAMYFHVPTWLPPGSAGGTPQYPSAIASFLAPDGNGYYQPVEGVMYQGSPVAVTTPLYHAGYYGSVPGILFLNKTTTGPQPGDTLTINGHNYLYLTQQTISAFSNWNYGVVLGPIS